MSQRQTAHIEEPLSIRERFECYVSPPQLMVKAIYFYILTFFSSPSLFFRDHATFRHKAFGALWARYGAAMSEEMPEGTIPLIATAQGVVLDIGPGSGTQLHLFDPSKVTKVYGVEPAADLIPELIRNAEKAGLGTKYEAIVAGAESISLIPALAKRNLLHNPEKGSTGIFDTIVTIRVLCGVPHNEETAAGLFRLLKPGGRLLVVEHVVQPYPKGGDFIAKRMQQLYMLFGWWYWLGGCCLDRDTEQILRKVAGKDGWKEVNLKFLGRQHAIPYIVGELVKA
ncbi:S-adenosyl-L-methionine-dependent methyltransferase [Tothia fuscella]|uniref:S-adenosyl-L-methionine-dependent methyltransferase n=1 Tax=Tothia fuscella TaxID=1048955 RepID=A0A9P4NWY4_9PEZI|nr:S-adenosyl-L-methionine-dependent methyltransferase [Tothia fuscella]